MSGFFRGLLPIKPTATGRTLIVSSDFQLNCVQRIDRAVPEFIRSWNDVELFIRNIVVRALMPHREYTDEERVSFYTRYFADVDAAVVPIVNMFLEFSKNPKEFARVVLEKRGIKFPPLPVAKDVPHQLFDGHDALADLNPGGYVDVAAHLKEYDIRGLKRWTKQEQER